MVPDFEQLRRPVLEKAAMGERRISEVVEEIADDLKLSQNDREELLPSGKQTRFTNRVHWAKSYLKHAGLVKNTRWGYYQITERGLEFLKTHKGMITKDNLRTYSDFLDFENRTNNPQSTKNESTKIHLNSHENNQTPDELMRDAYAKINKALALELLDKVRDETPIFFERLIVGLLLSMGYGGSQEDAGRALGQSNDGGIDGVIDQDPLGVDQIFIQAKRYANGNNIGSGAIRDFFGALNIKRATKGIFFTTSKFTTEAKKTASDLGSRIVLIDGDRLANLIIQYNIGCRTEDTLKIKKVDEDFFEAF